ncbi:DUF2868 domain-containing protein [Ottowia pentelensis]|uniref:DUF2868 domain-containing protein n=1 Tax=Ottowia pentelensis TaxID=511108 RepID=A0ABV6PV99_9BURK
MTPPSPSLAFEHASPLARALVGAAVQHIESAGALDDAAELRQAFAAQPTRAAQVQARAWLLGRRLGLPQELARWRQWGGWVALALAVLIALAGLAAGRSVLAPDRSINAVAAFVSLLGLHALTLTVWLLGLLATLAGLHVRLGDWSLGRLALGLVARWPQGRGPHALDLWRGFGAVMQRQRLWPWLTGLISHGIWTAAFVLTLAVLAFGFAFQTYRLSWQTTILSAEFFQRFVQITGALPAALGFPVPDAQAVAQVGQAGAGFVPPAAGQREWAWWLMGCVAVYGLLPRALLALLSAWRWRAGVARLKGVDMADPEVQRIVRRLDALEPPPAVIDAEHPGAGAAAPAWPAAAPGAPGSWRAVGFELPPDQAWPLPPDPAAPPLHVSGSQAERQSALQQLAATRPQSLLLLVHAPASPDRGTARFVREAAALAQRAALWPLGAGDDQGARWRDWLKSEHFDAVALVQSAPAALDWIANHEVADA